MLDIINIVCIYNFGIWDKYIKLHGIILDELPVFNINIYFFNLKKKLMKQKLFAEAVGTMVLVLMGCGAAVFNGGAGSVAAVLTIAFAFGLSVVAMAYTIGGI